SPFARLFFFFQAADGIRDFHVTGVQTCALPISHLTERLNPFQSGGCQILFSFDKYLLLTYRQLALPTVLLIIDHYRSTCDTPLQIGRASCRESLEMHLYDIAF